METPSTYGHVSGLSIYDRPSPEFDPLLEWRAQIERRLNLLEPLTRRLRNVPFNLDHPFWIEDPAIKAIKSAIGCTVNDVVMAVCAGGLRTYLARRDALPGSPMVAMIPVSIRTGQEVERWSSSATGRPCR